MSTLGSTPLAPPPIPASALPNGGSRPLTDGVFQTAEEAVLVQGGLPDDAAPGAARARHTEHGSHEESMMTKVRSQVAARPYQAALLAAAAGGLAMWMVRRGLRGRFSRR